MYNYHNIESNSNMIFTPNKQRNTIIQEVKQQFASFGYREIHTPAFQPYDLYMQMNGTVNQQEMIKTIDNSGKVLVLRPDVTIPLTEKIAIQQPHLTESLRYFYILDVFRQVVGTAETRESTQIGAEFFGDASATADAEIIALSMDVLNSFHLNDMMIELGHAGFFKTLIQETSLQKQALNDLKKSIRAKNVAEIDAILDDKNMDADIKEIITTLPFLYGQPDEVMKQAKSLPLTTELEKTLDNILNIYAYLDAYGIKNQIILDLSLINHMDYYSDIIFQGFIKNVGKPILMGGRYNTLANQFGADIPAVGFAFNLDLILEHTNVTEKDADNIVDVCIFHQDTTVTESIHLAHQLRTNGFTVINNAIKNDYQNIPSAKKVIYVEENTYIIEQAEGHKHFTFIDELITFLQKEMSS